MARAKQIETLVTSKCKYNPLIDKYRKGAILYLTNKINQRLFQFGASFVGTTSREFIAETLQEAFKPWRIKVVIDEDPMLAAEDICIGGSFSQDRKRQNIELILYFKQGLKQYKWGNIQRDMIMFLASQVLQHELIHRHQHENRSEEARGFVEYYPVASLRPSMQGEMDYLSECDEIEAYAHDIALEIRFYYNKHNPYDILRNIGRRHYVTSYKMYKKAFKHAEDWSIVHDRLLKKVYQWLPFTESIKWNTHY